MPEKIRIQANLGNLLTYIGTLYRNPRDAIKEYVSNAIDRWGELKKSNAKVSNQCEVNIILLSNRIIVKSHSQSGQNKQGLRDMMTSVADSIKPKLGVPQIGRLAIGIFAYNQIGEKAIFFSRDGTDDKTWKLLLSRGSDHCEVEEAKKQESLEIPGMDIHITGLFQNPLKKRSALNPTSLGRYLAEYFDYYLRDNSLKLTITYAKQILEVGPLNIALIEIGKAFKHIIVGAEKPLSINFWYEPSANGRISIRNQGVVVIDDIKKIDEVSEGFINTIYASGYIRGMIDVDFLKPLPARTGFEVDANWNLFIDYLYKIESSIQAEVEEQQLEDEIKRLENVKDEAKKLALDILDNEMFQDLSLLGGIRKKRGETVKHESHPTTDETGERSKYKKGDRPNNNGFKFNYRECPLGEPSKHSKYVPGWILINTENPHYQLFAKGNKKQGMEYVTTLIGKETIGYNDESMQSDYYLEKQLSFVFELKNRMSAKIKTDPRISILDKQNQELRTELSEKMGTLASPGD